MHVLDHHLKKWLILALISTGATLAQARDYPQLTPSDKLVPGRVRLAAGADYLDSNANFDNEGGAFEKIGGGRYYKAYDVDLTGEFHLTRRWAFTARAGFSFVESFDTVYTRTNSGPTEVGAGVRYHLVTQLVDIYPDFEFLFPINRVNPNTDEALTGEGAMALRSGVWLKGELWRLSNYAFIGATYRDEGRSMLLPWRLGTVLKFSPLSVGGELSGFESMTEDKYTDTPAERTRVTDRVNGGSLRYYSINPSLMELRGWVGWDLSESFSVKAGYGATINGKNSAHESILFLQAELAVGGDSRTTTVRKKRRRSRPSRSDVDRFDVESEEYDESLFEQKRRRRQQRQQQDEDVNVDQLLNETQESLE